MMTATQRLSAFASELRDYHADPVEFARRVLEVDPHFGQQRWLRESTNTENALVTGNRWGKTFTAAMKAVWKCAYRKGWNQSIAAAMRAKHEPYHAINVSITADQSRLVWQKARSMLEASKAQWLVKDVLMSPFPKIIFTNGSVLEARSTARDAEHLLGNSYDFVSYDEAAFEKKFLRVRDNVLRMRVVDRAGAIDYTSTGNGRNDFGLYYLKGLEGKDPDLYSQTGSSFENPHIDADRLRKNVERMSAKMRAQNIDGAIIDGGGDYFSPEDLEVAYDASLDTMLKEIFDDEGVTAWAELFVEGESWRDAYPSHKYVSGWDLADKQDWTVGTTWDVTAEPITLVEFERFHRKGWEHVYDRMRARDAKYGPRSTKFDSTGVGDVVADGLRDISAEGINFAGNRKDAMLTNVQSMLSLREVRWPNIRVFRSELAFYEREDVSLVTDCVMSAAVALWFSKRGIVPDSTMSFGAVDARAVRSVRAGARSTFTFGGPK